MPQLFVTNFNRNFTGVSATAANVVRQQTKNHDMRLVGHALPDCPAPISVAEARRLSRDAGDKPFAIWHVRRNPEMRAAIWARDVLRLPIKTVFTSAAQRWHSAYPRWLISKMDRVIATTPEAAEFVPNLAGVVPHGVDTELYVPAANRAKDWDAQGYGGRFGIASIGRIRPEKGTDRFVAAMIALMQGPHRDGRALVIGKATSEHQGFLNTLKATVNKAGLAKNILFPGEIPAAQMPALMRSLSFVVQLPRYEGYGMVPLEAMASGVPFIATNAGHYEAFSDGGRAGYIVDGSPASVCQHLNRLLDDESTANDLSMHARKFVQSHHAIANEVAGIEAVYEQLWRGD